LGRPAVVPPAGTGRGLDARPCRGAGGDAGGALSSKAPREAWPARRSEPYRGRDGVGCGRLGDRSLTLGDAEGTCGPRGLDLYREVGGLEGREGGWRPRVASMFVAVVALDRLDNKPPASEVKKMAKQNGDGSGSGA
jgi:hypothetical protein